MICSKDEFLLVLRNWMCSSQRVVLSVMLGEPTSTELQEILSSTCTLRLTGYISNVDKDGWFFAFNTKVDGILDDDFATIGLEGWEYAYADPIENPAMRAGILGVPEHLREAFSLTRINRAQIGIFALDPPKPEN